MPVVLSILARNKKIGVRNFVPPFKIEFILTLKSLNPQNEWKNILHYGNHNHERTFAIWLYPKNHNGRM